MAGKTKSSAALQPATALWDMYRSEDARYAFHASDRAEARRWQTKTRRAFSRILGLDRIPQAPANARVVERVDRGRYVREKIVMHTGPHTLMPVYILHPKETAGVPPTVLAFHGHGYGVKDIVGLWEDGSERTSPDGYHKDFGVALCKAGFTVVAPEISCFGERRTDFSYLDRELGQEAPTTCTHSSMLAFHLGITVQGLRVHDALRLVDYLEERDDVDTSRLGAMGISGGGAHTFFSTCIDPRIRACVISGYYSTFRDSILAMHHCACNFIPGLADFGEMQDLVGLIAPRPLLIEAGTRDPIFPIRAVRSAVAGARSVYGVFGAKDKVETDYFEGRHQISGRKAYDFLKRELTR